MLLTGEDQLHIDRLRLEYLVPARHPAPARLKARLDDAITGGLARALEGIAERLFPASEATVLLVRSLEVNIDINTSWGRDVLVQKCAQQIARLLDSIQQGLADGENVLHFPNRSAYLAHFLVDLAEGHAWGKWYYSTFEGLRMLPTSTAVRTAICEQPEMGLAALLSLPSSGLSKVLHALSTRDARRTVDSLAQQGYEADESRCLQALWTHWESREGEGQMDGEEQQILRLYLETCRSAPTLAGQTLRSSVLALSRLARCLSTLSSTQARVLLLALSRAERAALYTTLGTSDAEALLPLLQAPHEWLEEVGEKLLAHQLRFEKPPIIGEARYSPFGSLFILLPFLDALPLQQATSDWPALEEISPAHLVRFIVFLKCCGQARALQAFADPLVRDLLGIPPALSLQALRDWQRHISRTRLAVFQNTLRSQQFVEHELNARQFLLVQTAQPGTKVAVLLDSLRGTWLMAVGVRNNGQARLREHLQATLRPFQEHAELLISDALFGETLQETLPFLTVVTRTDDVLASEGKENPSLQEILARLHHLQDDMNYLAFPRTLRVSLPVDLTFSVIAQGVLRTFASRLPGFALSSLPYLASNFLQVTASLEDEAERRVVRIGRPPLNIILSMTSMARKTYRVAWLDERPFILFQEG